MLPEKYFYSENDVARRELLPGVFARLIWGEKIMMWIIDIEPDDRESLLRESNGQRESHISKSNDSDGGFSILDPFTHLVSYCVGIIF